MAVLPIRKLSVVSPGADNLQVSRLCWTACSLVGLVCAAYLGAVLLGLRNFSTLGFLYLLGYVKLAATIIKCSPLISCHLLLKMEHLCAFEMHSYFWGTDMWMTYLVSRTGKRANIILIMNNIEMWVDAVLLAVLAVRNASG